MLWAIGAPSALGTLWALRAAWNGRTAIDRELERIRPLFEQGGVIPHLNHLVPPDISYSNCCDCLQKKRKMIGKE
ncbi:MAG: hypothetical protein ACE15C_21105 [Phycisphaerae bacterium]